MATDIQKLFTSLGLSPTETKIYLSSLELGPTSVQEIAKKAKISRTAAYDAIESLQKHSLLSTFERGKKHYFAAEDPESAVAHFKTELSNMQAQLENLQRVLPELKMMTGGERPTVTDANLLLGRLPERQAPHIYTEQEIVEFARLYA